MKKSILLALLACFIFGQTEPLIDIMQVQPRVFVLQNATVHPEPGKSISGASIAIRDGLIEAVGTTIKIPEDATILEMDGAHIYAGFLNGWVEVDANDLKPTSSSHWIDLVHPEWIAAESYRHDEKKVEALHKMGFTQIHAIPDTGIFRGQSSIIDLDEAASISVSTLSQTMDFFTRERGQDGYPEALLGTIAVMRQTLYDADWYAQAQEIYSKHPDKNEAPKANAALITLAQARLHNTPFLIKTDDEVCAQRAIHVAREFELKFWLMGSGYEYRRLTEIAEQKPFIILPLDFPEKPDVSDPYRAAQYTTEQLKHWDMAPDNARKMVSAGVDIAFSTRGLSEPQQFRKNLCLAVERGLSETAALAALTTTPAKHFGLADTYGKIAPGYHANLVVVDGSYFDTDNPVRSLWIRGTKIDVDTTPECLPGTWDFALGDFKGQLSFTGEADHLNGSLKHDTSKISLDHLNLDGQRISWSADLNTEKYPGITRLRGSLQAETLSGTAHSADGSQLSWTATNHHKTDSKSEPAQASASPLKLSYPEGAFGFEQAPEQPAVLFINDATVWTSGPQGIINNCDLLIEKGKIKRIGKDLPLPGGTAKIIEADGKHVTAGMIDPHSHTAGASINEGSQSVTSEVRIQDVLDPDEISIYRELAGGLTTIHVLHGSANTIGGQNAIIKLRWGQDADGLIMKEAPMTLKFALGENVKQSNWGDDNITRYPQTRMGVEQVLRDAFTRARDYKSNLETYARRSKWRTTLIPPRKDLELDALVEVLEGTRRAHVHSYRQDEILMMIRVADDFGFKLANLEHVLEGYKVAEKMAEHGVGAATFTDWWGYKFEVYDAIPYNAILMQQAGVLVSFKSDSDELARRMNLEAAKGIKYGGMTRIEAMNTVTINPAKQLKIDQWVGSLEVGKDADFVVWSGDPLSTQSLCEQTWIDGRQYFSREQNARLLARDTQIRQELIQKILMTKTEEKPGKEKTSGSPHHSGADGDGTSVSREGGIK